MLIFTGNRSTEKLSNSKSHSLWVMLGFKPESQTLYFALSRSASSGEGAYSPSQGCFLFLPTNIAELLQLQGFKVILHFLCSRMAIDMV